jgi:magnesium transporter
MERSDAADVAAVLACATPAVGARVFRAIGPTPAAACAGALSDATYAGILAELPLDAAGSSLRRAEPPRRDQLLALLAAERADQLRLMLRFPEDTAGAVADPLVLALADDISVADAQRRLRGSSLHLHYYIYVITRDGLLVGAVSIPELMAARGKDALADVIHRDVVALDAWTDLVTVEAHPAWRDFDVLPVVDGRGRLVGAIRHKAVRQMSWSSDRPMVATLVGLSELYWAGLTGILRSLAPAEDQHVS